MDQFLYQCDDTYITVCSDVFSSAFAPGVSAPQSLGLDPEIVLADEPTGALDQTTGHEIMSILMRTARQTGAAVVVVTHDSNVAAFCDATVTMRDGRLSSPQQSQPTAGGAR